MEFSDAYSPNGQLRFLDIAAVAARWAEYNLKEFN